MRQPIVASLRRGFTSLMRQPIIASLRREFAPLLKLPLGRLAVVLAALLACVMFFTASGGIFAWLLGTDGKNETITYIGLGLGGVLAAMGALALNRRAEEMAKHNELIAKGHVDERLKAAVQNLGNAESSVRIIAFYQFYYLTKGNKDTDFVKNIFDILCSHLRQITSKEEYRNDEGREKPTEECQSLLDVLFKNPQNVFATVGANLRGVYLVGADFHGANAQGINFREAKLQGAKFSSAKLQGASFNNAKLQKAVFSSAKLHGAIFNSAKLQEVSFDEADLRRASFYRAIMEDATFMEADLRGARLWKVKAYDAIFHDANIEGARCWDANMHGANLFDAQCLDKVNFYRPIKISASDVERYPDWFKEGTHYTVAEPE